MFESKNTCNALKNANKNAFLFILFFFNYKLFFIFICCTNLSQPINNKTCKKVSDSIKNYFFFYRIHSIRLALRNIEIAYSVDFCQNKTKSTMKNMTYMLNAFVIPTVLLKKFSLI